ncbi:MAG: chitobiase/beta-hexosaminidase C-terminal domain-containing protein [Candidatus Methanoperedens sp.]
MKKLFLLLTVLLIITTVSARIEQHTGFPINTGSAIKTRLVVQDIDGDGKFEIIAAPENRMIKVFNHLGALNWENIGGRMQTDEARVPLVANISGRLEIISYGNPGYSDATFYIWDTTGNNLANITVGKDLLLSNPAITKEGIILTGAAPGTSLGTITQATGVYAFDSFGNKLRYLELGRAVNYLAPIPVGDIDGDGIDEAVILTQDINSANPIDGKIWVIKVNSKLGTLGTILWSMDLGGDARSAEITDLDGNGMNEVIVTSSSGTYIFDNSGNQLYKFNINSNLASPGTGDIDGTGVIGAAIASNDEKKVYLIRNGSLKEFSSIGRVASNLALGDINGDGGMEIAAGDLYGNVYVWDNHGNVLENTRVTNEMFTSAVIADLEGDGNKEIILGNSNGNIYVYTYINKPEDTIPPTTTDDVDGQWHNFAVLVTLTAKDNESGAAATYYTIDGTEPTVNSSRGTTFTILNDGIYTIKYFSMDKAGNVEQTKTAINQVKIDKTPPLTTGNADGQWHNSSVAVMLSASDAGSGVMETYYTPDGSIPTASSQKGATISISGEGNHTIRYYSVDNAGNAEQPNAAIVKIDKTPPQTVDDSDNMWHTADVTLNITASDNISGIESIRYIVDGIEQVSYSPNIQLTFNKEGVNNITYFSVDNAGNVEAMKTAVVRIDRTPPTTMDDSDGKWHNSDITLKLSATDNLSGVHSTYYKVDPANKNFIQSLAGWFYNVIGLAKTDTLQGDSISISEEGVFDIQYYSDDNAGNEEIPIPEKSMKQVKIDKTPPVTQIALSGTLGGTCYGSDVIVSLNTNDALSGKADTIYTLDSTGQLSYAGAFTVSGEGSHLLKYISTDKAGNNELQKSASFSIDKTPPEAVIKIDKVLKEIKVYNSETGSESNYLVLPNGKGEESQEDTEGWELREYTLLDCAGNSMILELGHKKEDEEVRIKVISMKYYRGELPVAANNIGQVNYIKTEDGASNGLRDNSEDRRTNHDDEENDKEFRIKLEVKNEHMKDIIITEILTDRGGMKAR